MNPTEVKMKMELGGRTHTAYFNMNTYCAWEDEMGRPFMSMLSAFLVAYEQAIAQLKAQGVKKPTEKQLGPLVAKLVDLREFTALIWASLHTYDDNDTPHWPMTIGHVRRLVTFENVGEVLPRILTTSTESLPDKEDMPEKASKEATEASPTLGSRPEKNGADGGQLYGPTDESILESLTPNLDDSPSVDTTDSSESSETEKPQPISDSIG